MTRKVVRLNRMRPPLTKNAGKVSITALWSQGRFFIAGRVSAGCPPTSLTRVLPDRMRRLSKSPRPFPSGKAECAARCSALPGKRDARPAALLRQQAARHGGERPCLRQQPQTRRPVAASCVSACASIPSTRNVERAIERLSTERPMSEREVTDLRPGHRVEERARLVAGGRDLLQPSKEVTSISRDFRFPLLRQNAWTKLSKTAACAPPVGSGYAGGPSSSTMRTSPL
jgi:hypothetical protein